MKRVHRDSRIRLKKLLKITGLKGSELARLTGTSYPLFLKVHGGERGMSLEYAELIMTVTGIDPRWLLGKNGSLDIPKTVEGNRFSKETYTEWCGKGGARYWLTQSLEKNFETVPVKLRRMAWEIVRLGIASARSNRLYVTVYHFEKFIKETIKALEIEKRMIPEEVKFLPFNPYNYRLNGSKVTLKSYMIPNAKSEDGELNDMRPSGRIAGIFNPTFLFELSEGIDSGNSTDMEIRLKEAEASLALLKKHLLK